MNLKKLFTTFFLQFSILGIILFISNFSLAQCPTVTETITNESCDGACDGQIQVDITGGGGPFTVEWFDGGGASLGVINNVVTTETITGLCAGNYSVDVTSSGGSTPIWTETFDPALAGWNLNVSTGVNGVDNNFFVINDNEGGVIAGGCGVANNGNNTLHVTSVFFPTGGAAYDAGGLCGVLFCPEANVRSESPNISSVGFSGLTLNFNFISQGDALNDNASLWYNDGGGWTLLDPSLKSNMCALQGQWTTYSIALPASCDNIANLQIGFNWTNNDDGVGSDPSFAVNDIEIVTVTGAPCTTNEPYAVTSPGPCVCPTVITETITDESCPTLCDGKIEIDVTAGTGPYTIEWFDGGGASLGVTNNVVLTDSITGLCAGNYSVEVTESSGGGGGGSPTTIWTETFDPVLAGWTLNVPTGTNGVDNNFFVINDNEGGMPDGQCGVATNGDNTLHVTSVFFPNGGAAYDAGGLCGLLFCPEANVRSESPNISTVGFTSLTLDFTFISQGEGMNDNASLWYNDGGGWTLLDPSLKSNMCALQGEWTAYSVALPVSCENIANLQIGFNWTNNDDGVGSDPSFAVNDINIVSIAGGGGGGVGCVQTANFTVAPGLNPVIANEAHTDITNCVTPDGTITITANGTSYETFTSAGVSVSTNTTGSFTGLTAGDYYVEVTINACLTTSSMFTITNASAPAAPSNSGDVSYCVGDVINDITATVGAGGTLNWYSDAGLTTNIGTGTNLTPGNTVGATIYYVTETLAGCESAASIVTVTITVCCDLTVSTVVTDETCDGADDGVFDFTVSGSGSYNVVVGGATAFNSVGAGTYNLPNQTDGIIAIQVVDVSDPSCDTTFNLTINPGILVTVTSESSTDITDCLNPDGTFSVVSNGTSFELFTSAGGSVATNATGNFTGLNAGDYYVVASIGGCTAQSATLTISNASAPSAPTAGLDAAYCQGDPLIDLTAVVGSGGTLNWYSDGALTVNIGAGGLLTPSNTVGVSIYYVTETVTGCESPATAITITINAIPSAPVVGTDATYCMGDPLTDLTATAGSSGTLNWFSDAGLSINIGTGTVLTPSNTLGTTTYFVTESVGGCVSISSSVAITINATPVITAEIATDLTDCVSPNGTITITANGTSYELFTSTGISLTTNATGAFTGLGVGDYYVEVSNGTCSTTGTTLSIVDQTSSSSNTVNNSVCPGSSYVYADGTISSNILANESHISTLTNTVGCDSVVTENITLLQTVTTIVDTTICEGTNYTSVGNAASFTNVLTDFTHSSVLIGSNGCDSTIIENITVTPTASLDLGPDLNSCFGETITLTATSNAGIPIWSTGDTAMTITYPITVDTFIVAGVSGSCGFSTDTVFITVFSAPIIDAGIDQTVPLGAQVQLGATSSANPTSFSWSPGTTLSCDLCADPLASPFVTTSYVVIGIDENGCVGSDTVTIIVDGEIAVFIPNVFSPNGDGENDLFKVFGPQWTTYSMKIYNRWGGLVFESEDENVAWDGTKNDELAPQAIFVYKFYGVSIVGMTFERAGNVMLTR